MVEYKGFKDRIEFLLDLSGVSVLPHTFISSNKVQLLLAKADLDKLISLAEKGYHNS